MLVPCLFCDFAICFNALSYLFTTYLGTNLLMVAKVHKFLFLYFMCRNYLDKGKKSQKEPCWSWTLTLPKYVPTRQVLEIASETPEDDLKRKNLKLQSCREFFSNGSRYKIRPNPSSDALSKPVLLKT